MNQPKKSEHLLAPFLYPKSYYRGKWTPSNFIFNANLQEFTQKINYLCNLVGNGKLSPEEAYQQIQNLWQKLEQSKQELDIK